MYHFVNIFLDFGFVKLFRFPCLKKGAKFRKYVGHSSHVTNVRFNKDKTRVLSIGGADHAIFQWRFMTEEGVDAKEYSDKNSGYQDSNSEDSDSDLSGKEVDSDIENEKEISYDRSVCREDLVVSQSRFRL